MIIVAIIALVAIVFFVTRRAPSNTSGVGSQSIRPDSESPPRQVCQPTSQSPSACSVQEIHLQPTRLESAHGIDLSLLPEQFVVLDLETTGLSPEINEIIEIGAIRVNRESDTHASFQTLVRPEERIPRKITQITGITQGMVDNDGILLSDALAQFKEFVGDLPLVAFNASFDMGFIWRAAKEHGVTFDNRYTCALKLSRRAYPDLPSHRLEDLARMGNLSDENTHRALGDCKRTVTVFMGSVMKIGERIVWEVPSVDWRTSVQYQKERASNRAFIDETRALEASNPGLTVTRYREAMARMYEYEKLIHNWSGDDQILDRLTLVLGKLGRHEELIGCANDFIARFPEAHSSAMTAILKRKQKAESKLESASNLTVH